MKILCATDLLPKSDAAVERAHALRTVSGGRLTFLHVVQLGDGHEGTLEQRLLSAQSRLARLARRATAPVEMIVRCGRPVPVLRDVAVARRADLVVIGPHVGEPVGDALRGTLIERVVADARCPVLVVRRPAPGGYRRIMLALDRSALAGHVVTAAERMSADGAASWSVVHAHEPPYEALMTTLHAGDPDLARYSALSMTQAVAAMRARLREHSRAPRAYRVVVVEAPPATAIRRAIADAEPELLVLGTRGFGRFRRALLGSTAHEVLNATDCDVLLVPDVAVRAARKAVRSSGAHAPLDGGPDAA